MAGKQLVATGRRFALALRRQRKVLLLFLLTILLPAAVLSVFGLRALEADRYRMERLMRREQEEAMHALRGRLASHFDRTAGILERVARAHAGGRSEWAALRREVLSRIESKELPEEVVAVTDSGDFFYVREGFVSLPSDRPDPETESEQLMEAQRLEHSRNEPREAASRYARLAKSELPEVRLPALNGLGRTFVRSGDLEKAIATYRELLRQQPEILTTETAVLPLMAGLQIAFCYEELGQGQRALPDLVAAYGEMIDRRWIVASETLAFYSSEYENVIAERCSKDRSNSLCSTYQRLATGKAARLARIRDLERLRRDLPPLLVPSRTANEKTRKILRLPGSTVVAAGFSEGLTLAAVIGDSALLALATGREDRREGAVRTRVKDHRGQVVSGSTSSVPGEVYLEERLGEGFPDWKVAVFHDPADAAHLTDVRKSIYGILTVTLISALLLGAFLMARAVHHEMELIRIKSDFISLVSHEFKTPIASMRALVDRLQAGHVPDRDRMQRYYDIVSGELQRLTRLVNNVLDFSRIEEGRKTYSPQETDLTALVRELVATFEVGASAKGFAIETAIAPDLPRVRVDRDSISQALLNLLDNAVKYSQAEKWICVGVERNSHSLMVTVADRGSGIGTGEVSRIFEKFYRSPAAAERGVPGLGLGLSLVEHVMRSHGGKVTVESEPGSGSTFRLSIPLETADDQAGFGRTT